MAISTGIFHSNSSHLLNYLMKLLLYVREECERVSESFAGEQKKNWKCFMAQCDIIIKVAVVIFMDKKLSATHHVD
jgi:hypothetical protein